MSFSRCKALLRLAKISPRNPDFNHEIGHRFYSREVIFSSAAPHEMKVKTEEPHTREQPKRERVRYKKFVKPQESSQKESSSNQFENHDSNINDAREEYKTEQRVRKRRSFRSDPVSSNQFGEHNLYIENVSKQTNTKPYRRNIKLHERSYYQFQHDDSNISSTRTLDRIPDSKENDSFASEQLDEEEIRHVVKLEPVTNVPGTENLTVLSPVGNGIVSRDSKSENRVSTRYKFMESPEGPIKYDLSADEFNIDNFIKDFNASVPGPLDECNEDLSDFGPSFSPTFNFAAYADKSRLIQEYVKLGVKLYKVEKNDDHMRALLSVDLEKELPVYIQFLHDCGVPADSLGDVITENPLILKEDLDDMKTRIRYLRAHKFSKQSIARILTLNPSWLLWATKFIDERLGHFQNEFKLYGPEVRFLATKQPKLITYKLKHVHENTFAIREEMGFNGKEMKLLLLYKPRLWMNSRNKIVNSFDYLHNTMKLSHLMIASQADVLTCRKSRLKNRHEFLVELKKVQYDPRKPGYIAPKSIAAGSDEEFCRDVAKTAVDTYNLFLKTR